MARVTCPLCGRITLPSERKCLCGFDFGLLDENPTEVRRMLERKVSTSGIHGAAALLGAVAALGMTMVMPPLAIIGSIALMIRGGTQLTTRRYVKRALRAHNEKYALLPAARVHRLPEKS